MRASVFLFISQLLLTFAFVQSSENNSKSAADLITKGDGLRASGKVKHALQAYDDAIKLEPLNYLVLFKRGAVYMSIPGKEESAIADFSKVLEIRPDFTTALKQRSSLYLKLGQLDNVEKDAELLSSMNKKKSTGGGQQESKGKSPSDKLLEKVSIVKNSIANSTAFLEKKDYGQCTNAASEGLNISPSSAELLKIRIECNLNQGLPRAVLHDLNSLEHSGFNDNFYAQDALIQYFVFHKYDAARSKLQRCLQLNMDSQPCKSAFIEIGKFEKKFGKYAGIADADKENKRIPAENDKVWYESRKVLLPSFDSEVKTTVISFYEKIGFPKIKSVIDPSAHSEILTGLEETLCVAFYNAKLFTDSNGAQYCNMVISRDKKINEEHESVEQSVRSNQNSQVIAHLFIIEKLISEDNFNKAQQEIENALRLHPHNHRLNTLKHDLGNRKVQAKNTDYYKILGVAKSASEKDIRSAYREKTKQYHPDKYRGEMSADEVDKKMAEVNQAYEVLSNPELRARFDRGDDPNNNERPDPGHHQQGGFNPNMFQQQMFQQFFKGQGQGRQHRHGGGNGNFYQQFGNNFKQQQFQRGRGRPKQRRKNP